IDVLEADEPERVEEADARPVFPGDDVVAVKDPIVRRAGSGVGSTEPQRGRGGEAWSCCPPLHVADEEGLVSSAYATSDDGLRWRLHGTVLAPRPGAWDARGARL